MNDERCDRDRVTAVQKRADEHRGIAIENVIPIGYFNEPLLASVADVDYLAARLLEALDTIDKARELHTPTRFAETDERGYDAWCLHCRAPGPCPTWQALNGGNE